MWGNESQVWFIKTIAFVIVWLFQLIYFFLLVEDDDDDGDDFRGDGGNYRPPTGLVSFNIHSILSIENG